MDTLGFWWDENICVHNSKLLFQRPETERLIFLLSMKGMRLWQTDDNCLFFPSPQTVVIQLFHPSLGWNDHITEAWGNRCQAYLPSSVHNWWFLNCFTQALDNVTPSHQAGAKWSHHTRLGSERQKWEAFLIHTHKTWISVIWAHHPHPTAIQLCTKTGKIHDTTKISKKNPRQRLDSPILPGHWERLLTQQTHALSFFRKLCKVKNFKTLHSFIHFSFAKQFNHGGDKDNIDKETKGQAEARWIKGKGSYCDSCQASKTSKEEPTKEKGCSTKENQKKKRTAQQKKKTASPASPASKA